MARMLVSRSLTLCAIHGPSIAIRNGNTSANTRTPANAWKGIGATRKITGHAIGTTAEPFRHRFLNDPQEARTARTLRAVPNAPTGHLPGAGDAHQEGSLLLRALTSLTRRHAGVEQFAERGLPLRPQYLMRQVFDCPKTDVLHSVSKII